MENIDFLAHPTIKFFEVDETTYSSNTDFNPKLAEYLKLNVLSTLIDMEDPDNQ